jgi:hypothetical protein
VSFTDKTVCHFSLSWWTRYLCKRAWPNTTPAKPAAWSKFGLTATFYASPKINPTPDRKRIHSLSLSLSLYPGVKLEHFPSSVTLWSRISLLKRAFCFTPSAFTPFCANTHYIRQYKMRLAQSHTNTHLHWLIQVLVAFFFLSFTLFYFACIGWNATSRLSVEMWFFTIDVDEID